MTKIEAAVEALKQLPEDQLGGYIIGWQVGGVAVMAGIAAICEDGFAVWVQTGYDQAEGPWTVQDVIPFEDVLMVGKVLAEGEVEDAPVEPQELLPEIMA